MDSEEPAIVMHLVYNLKWKRGMRAHVRYCKDLVWSNRHEFLMAYGTILERVLHSKFCNTLKYSLIDFYVIKIVKFNHLKG